MYVRLLRRTFKNIHRNLISQRIFVLFSSEFLRGTDWINKRAMASGGNVSFSLKFQNGDLFGCPKTDSLAHCVSRDLKMGKGIAVIFKKKFGQVDSLKRQDATEEHNSITCTHTSYPSIHPTVCSFHCFSPTAKIIEELYMDLGYQAYIYFHRYVMKSICDKDSVCTQKISPAFAGVSYSFDASPALLRETKSLALLNIGCDRIYYDMLLVTGKKVGEVAYIEKDGRYIYYLITKEKANDKPTYDDFKKSLQYMKKHCVFAKVAHLSMPRIGCGLDRLEWSNVEQILRDIFGNTNITITIYDLPQKEAEVKHDEKSHPNGDEKACPKDEMVSSKYVKALKADEKNPRIEDEKASLRKDEVPPKRNENAPSKEDEKGPYKGDEKLSLKRDEKAPSKGDENALSKGDEKPSSKRDEKVLSKGDEKNPSKRDEKAFSKRDEKVPSKKDEKAPPEGKT